MPLHMSVSSTQDFLTCRRLYYYKRIKKYEKTSYNLPFIVGRVVHEGLAALMNKSKDPKTGKPNVLAKMKEVFVKERLMAQKEYVLSSEQLAELDRQEFVTRGMLTAYATKYSKMIRDMKLMGSEVEGALQISDNATVVIKMDNIAKIRGKKVLHELKTTKAITPDYIKRIQTNLQVSVYYYFHNIIWPDEPIDEVLYDVIRKPSIKQKKKETLPEYMERLAEWYKKPDDYGGVFHIERFKSPGISESDTINTMVKVSEEMLRAKHKEDYFQDFEKCRSYFGDVCPYYSLCFEGGETKENLLLYQIRKSFHVDKNNKKVEDNEMETKNRKR